MTGFEISKKYVPRDELVKIAKVILRSQDIREDSWYQNKEEVGVYGMSIGLSVEEARNEFDLPELWAIIITHWNYSYWNESRDFANKILLQEEEEAYASSQDL